MLRHLLNKVDHVFKISVLHSIILLSAMSMCEMTNDEATNHDIY